MNKISSKFLKIDTRLWQLGIMAALLLLGVVARDFSLLPSQIALTFIAGLLTQAIFLKALKIPQRGFLSAFITCFGLCLLLRSSNLWVHPVVAVLAMASKFTIRPFGQHLFNPANLGVVLGLALFPETWVTSGQWGSDLSSALWLIAGGFFIARNAHRIDITAYFLVIYAALFLIIRILWYGYPIAVFFHQFQNGALLLFAFFMISDPMTIPHQRTARLIHAAIVAVLAYIWQYWFYWNQGIVWGLFFATFLVPLWNHLFPAPHYQWQNNSGDTKCTQD
ncbi:MAG: Na+-transporting NADH:ubiquinone oxidoreductase, subunit NqrB [Methylococcaceae bacterium]|nr:Na+-transporting NADH:ubiquinone oxidoreductase, subunit NqrB [Methylococcaceae bacterium]